MAESDSSSHPRDIRGLLPELRARAFETDQAQQLPDELFAELTGRGAFDALRPGQKQAPQQALEHLDTVRMLAGACTSTGWLAAVLGTATWHIGHFHPDVAEGIWAAGPSSIVTAAYAPGGTFRPVRGGYRFSGRWRFLTACDRADWAILGGLLVDERGGEARGMMLAVVPREAYEISRRWDIYGLRAVGGHQVRIADWFVPESHVLHGNDTAAMFARSDGRKLSPLYRVPFAALYPYAVTAAVIGAAEGALESHLLRVREESRQTFASRDRHDDRASHIAIARAAAGIDAASLQMRQHIDELAEAARLGEPVEPDQLLRARRDQCWGTERAVEAVDLLFRTAGRYGLVEGDHVQRAWRDAHAATAHVTNDIDHAMALFGRSAYGFEVELSQLL